MKINEKHSNIALIILTLLGVYLNHWFFTVPLILVGALFILKFIMDKITQRKNNKENESN